MSCVFRSLVAFAGTLALCLGFTIPASAMTVSSTGESGCSLRAAIQAVAANDSGTSCGAVVSGGLTPINLPANTYTPTDGQIVVPAGTYVEIIGDNVNNPLTTVIDGTGGTVGRIFEIKAGAAVKLSGLKVTGGRTPDAAPSTNIYTYNPVGAGGAILNQGSLTLDHVVLSGNRTGNGSAGSPPPVEMSGGAGGPGGDGGGIFNADNAILTITNSQIRDNLTGNGGTGGSGSAGVGGLGHNPDGKAGGKGGSGGNGGGIYNSNYGSVSIDSSTISGNDTGRAGNGGSGGVGAGPSPAPGGGTFGAGIGGDGGDGGNNGRQYRKDQGPGYDWDEVRGGGGIYSLGSLTVTNSTFSGNTTGAGGNGGPSAYGGENDNGTFRTSGRAGTGGGGGRGGGLVVAGNPGDTNLTNVTVVGNQTGDGGAGGNGILGESGLGGGKGGYGGDGGGIWVYKGTSGSLSVTHGTVSKNFPGAAGPGGGGANGSLGPGARGVGAGVTAGGRYNPSGSTVYLKNSIVSGNGNPALGDKNCVARYSPPAYVDFYDQGHNLTFPGGSDCPGTVADPELGNLGDHGGPTETMVPAAGSPAIGGVSLDACAVTIDQRGEPRPGADGTSCDIGAVETGAGDALTATTTRVVSSAQPSRAGQQITFTATVSPPPSSGTVAFKDGGTTISGCATTALKPGGKFTCTVTYGSAGTHSITAIYSGNTLFAASTSPVLTQTVNSGTKPPPPTARLGKLTVSGPSATKKGGQPTFKVRITNVGSAAASGVKLQVSGGGANLLKTLGGIPAGGAKTVRVRVRLKKTGHKTLTFKATSANAGSAKATKTVTVRRPHRRHHH